MANGNEPSNLWSIGAARYEEGLETPGGQLVVAVRCRFDGVRNNVDALLDSGAEWSVFGGELAASLRDQATPMGIFSSMHTRLGRIQGQFHRLSVTLLADDGEDFQIPATVLLAPDWSGPPVLGYRGFLERLRLALDPGASIADQWMYFGAVG